MYPVAAGVRKRSGQSCNEESNIRRASRVAFLSVLPVLSFVYGLLGMSVWNIQCG